MNASGIFVGILTFILFLSVFYTIQSPDWLWSIGLRDISMFNALHNTLGAWNFAILIAGALASWFVANKFSGGT
jgi:hypothetical protein